MPIATCTYFAHIGDTTAFLHLVGNASYVNCSAMAAFLADIGRSENRLNLSIDFSRCTGLDSTVLGLIAQVAMELSAKPTPGRVVLANLDGRNMELTKNLGLHHVCEVAETPISCESPEAKPLVPMGGPGTMCQSPVLLHAHEALVKANPENEPRFHDVIESLRGQS